MTFPITDDIRGRVRLDYRGRRGLALGFDSTIDYFNDSQARLKTYYLQDQNPNLNETNIPRKDVPTGRYRVSLADTTNFTDDIYGITNLTKLSDQYVMQDFFQGEFRIDPVPDNVIAVAKTDPFIRSRRSNVFRRMSFSPQPNVSRKLCWTSNVMVFSAVPFSMKARPGLPIYGYNSLRTQASRIMARIVSIPSIN